jgi:hypothetical protein
MDCLVLDSICGLSAFKQLNAAECIYNLFCIHVDRVILHLCTEGELCRVL